VSKELEEFKSKCDIAKVVSHYVSLEKVGSNYRGLCPFHEEKTPSFYVNVDKGFFHCFGCGASGDVIEFVKRIENLSFVEAVQRVAELCGIDPPLMSKDTFYSSYVKLMERVATNYANVLLSVRGEKAWHYLNKKRGLSKEDAKKFSLGYAPINSDVIRRSAKELKIDENMLIKNGLLIRTKSGRLMEFFRNRVIFPVKNSSGRVIAFGGRALGDEEPKYLNSAENKYFSKSKILYLFNRSKIKAAGFAIVCEGYMDAIAFHRNGFENACALLGTGLSKFHVDLLKSVTNNVLLMLDSDSAGVNAMKRAAKVLAKEELNVKVLLFEDSKDPDEFFSKHTSEEFKRILKNAVDYWDFYVQKSLGEVGDPIKALLRLKRSISWVNSSVLKRQLISKAARVLMMDEKDVMYELQNQPLKEENVKRVKKVQDIRMTIDDYVVYLLFYSDEMRERIKKHIDESIISPFAKKALDIANSGISTPQEALKAMDRNNGERFFQIFTKGIPDSNAERIYELCVLKLEERKLKHRIEKVEREMVSTPDRKLKAKLMKEAMELRSLLKRKGGASRG
jgi:DNA primase